MVFAGIAPDAADFAAFVDQHEQRRKPFHCDETQIRRQWIIDVYPPQGCPLAFFGLWVNRRNLAIECLAPDTTGLFKHYEFRANGADRPRKREHRGQKQATRKKFRI
jgi:hypothetical protein